MVGEKGNTYFVVGALAVLLGAGGVGYGVGQRNAAASLEGRLAGEIQHMQGRIATIESALKQANAHAGEVTARKGTDRLLSAVQQRLDAIETQLAALPPFAAAAPANAGETDDAPPPGPGLAALATSQEPLPPHGVSADYQKDSGESEWGTTSEQRIQERYNTDPYFARFGGSLTTACKQQTCKLEWALPDLDTLSAEDKQEALGTAEYQLMALAAQSAAQASRMSVEWSGNENQPRVTVFFSRAAAH
jgi:hypothetical protein